jgi:hypothetical protein
MRVRSSGLCSGILEGEILDLFARAKKAQTLNTKRDSSSNEPARLAFFVREFFAFNP